MERSPVVIKTVVNCAKENRSGESRACLQKEYCKGYVLLLAVRFLFPLPHFHNLRTFGVLSGEDCMQQFSLLSEII